MKTITTTIEGPGRPRELDEQCPVCHEPAFYSCTNGPERVEWVHWLPGALTAIEAQIPTPAGDEEPPNDAERIATLESELRIWKAIASRNDGMVRAAIEPGSISTEWNSSVLCIVAAECRQLLLEKDAKNYIAMELRDDHGAMEVIIQRKDGVTPSDKAAALQATVTELKAKLASRPTFHEASELVTLLAMVHYAIASRDPHSPEENARCAIAWIEKAKTALDALVPGLWTPPPDAAECP